MNFAEALIRETVELRGRKFNGLYPHQRELWERLSKNVEEAKLIILKAPTASGKTEAGLSPYLAQFIGGFPPAFPAVIYALPVKTLIYKQFDRIKLMLKAARKLFLQEGLHVNLQATIDHGGPLPYKPFLFGDIVVCTIDALAYAFLEKRAIGNRYIFTLGNVAGDLILLDEVQLLQDKYYYTPKVLGFIIAQALLSGSSVVVMTATMSSMMLKKALMAIKDDLALKDIKPLTIEAPMSSNVRGRVKIDPKPLKQGLDLKGFLLSGEGWKIVDSAIKEGFKVLIACNTVERAAQIYRELKRKLGKRVKEGELVILHGRLVREDRRRREAFLDELSARTQRFRSPLILVATQVIESGIDLPFDYVISEISPLDSLIQRVGRCARDPGMRGIAYIVRAEDSKPYLKELVERSAKVLCEDVQDVEGAVYDVNLATSLLDQVYTTSTVEKLEAKRDYLWRSFLNYLDGLTVTYPPPQENPRVRPDLYVTLLLLRKRELNELLGGRIVELPTRLIYERSLELDYVFIKQYTSKGQIPPFLVVGEGAYEVKVIAQREEVLASIKLEKITSLSQIRPLKTYALNPGSYDQVSGVKL